MTSLVGLQGIYSVGGDFWIDNNDLLIGLSHFDNLSSIGGDLNIINNASLLSLSGLNNIDPGSIANLSIYENPGLSNCHIQSICEYLISPNGIVEIYDNAPGCNSQQEVEEACWTSVDEIGLDDQFIIFPNPLESTTMIQYKLQTNSQVSLKILDLSGREMIVLVNEFQQQGEQQLVFNTANLPVGIYFCVLKTKDLIRTRKLIKL